MKFSTRLTNRLIIAGVVIVLGFLLVRAYYAQMKRERDYVFIKAAAIQTSLGWGYEILADGKPYIHQEFIPGLKGRKGFDTKEDALLVANKVIAKIKMKQVPPAINVDDLKELGILKASDSLLIPH
jgi:Domain of unknown function (DUF4907)